MACPRCKDNPLRTSGEHSALRRCAFDARGKFTADNWQCATLEALAALLDGPRVAPGTTPAVLMGTDEVLQIVPCDPEADHGWIAMTRTLGRNTVASAVHVGDHAPRVLTLGVAITTLAYWARRKNAETRADRLSFAAQPQVLHPVRAVPAST